MLGRWDRIDQNMADQQAAEPGVAALAGQERQRRQHRYASSRHPQPRLQERHGALGPVIGRIGHHMVEGLLWIASHGVA